MSDRSQPSPKSPFQSQRSTPQDPATEQNVCVPIKQQKPACSQIHTTISQNEKPNTPTRARWVSTLTQSQKPSTQNTPTNSLVCIPRDRPSATSTPTLSLACIPKTSSRTLSGSTSLNTTQRTAKAPSQFNPTATSTPRSSQMRQPWQISPTTTGCSQRRDPTSPVRAPRQGPPCPPRPDPQCARPIYTPVESKECPFTMCKCVPRTDASVQGASCRRPEAGRRDRILKLEILSVKGGTLYDRSPKYDQCYDVDPMIGIRPADSVTPKTTSGVEKVGGKFDGRPSLGSNDGGNTSRGDDESTLIPDSKAVESSASQDEDDIIRSAPVAPAPFHLSELSLTDMPPVREEEDEMLMDSLHIGEPPSVDLGEAPFGNVTLPNHQSDIAGLSKQSDTRHGSYSDAGVPVDEGVRVKEEYEGCRLKERDRGAPVNGEKDRVPERREDKDQTSTAQRTASELAVDELVTANGRGSFSLMLGPSVRNFARLALSPLVALRTLLGPASNGRSVGPACRKRRGRNFDEHDEPSGHARIRSIRSAFVVTPYGGSASTFAFLLRRRKKRRIAKRNVCSEDSSQ